MTHVKRARSLGPNLTGWRRDFHRHPELGFQENRTAEVVTRELTRLGLDVRPGVGKTGVVAELSTGSGPVVALRADMDALPIQEEGDHEYRSMVDGVMHACGHDAHIAGLLGAATLLAQDRDEGSLPSGTVRLLFQPSEEGMDDEGKSGGMRMVEDGAMDGVQAVAGLHVGAHLPSGKVFVGEGPIMAGSDDFVVVVKGRSSHAAMPHEGVDALVLAAQGVLAAQQAVSRKISPMENGVLTFGKIHGGVASNVVPDRVTLTGTLRYFDEDVRKRLREGLTGAFRALEPQGGTAEIEFQDGYPPVVNHRGVTDVARRVAQTVAGADNVWDAEPMMGAEDFAILARRAPGVFLWVGAACPDPREHHHPRFDIDETVLPLNAALLATMARELLLELSSGWEP